MTVLGRDRRWIQVCLLGVSLAFLPCASCGGGSTDHVNSHERDGGAGGGGGGARSQGAAGSEQLGSGGVDSAGSGGCGASIQFPDPVVEAAIRQELDTPTGPIDAKAVAAIEGLDVTGAASLQGLQCATALRDLYAESGDISSLAPLAGLRELVRLTVRNSRLDDLSPLRDMRQFYTVNVGNNNIQTIDGDELAKQVNSCPDISLLGNPLSAESLAVGIPALCEKGWWIWADTDDPWAEQHGICNAEKCYGE